MISAGLLWCSGVIPLSPFLHKYGGDALWALLMFLGFGFLFIRAPTWQVALMAFCSCCAEEFSQLYHAPWIDTVRDTRLGALTLGATFNWPDLTTYGAGIIFGCMTEIPQRVGAKS